MQDAYCHKCGQRSIIEKVTFKETFGDLINGLFSLEAPLWRTLKQLILNPGLLFRNFLAGKRKYYYKPVSFFILNSALYLLVRWLIDFDFSLDSTINVGDSGGDGMLSRGRTFMLLHIDKLLFFFVLSMSLLLKLFFYKRHSLAEYFAVSFYVISVYMIVQTFNIVYIQFVNPDHQWFGLVFTSIYFVWAMLSFFKKPKFWIFIKAIMVFYIGLFFYMFFAFGLSTLIVTL